MLFERTDKAQVEHLGGEESDAWKRQRLRIDCTEHLKLRFLPLPERLNPVRLPFYTDRR
jgi:hypothetical protein